ncbi:uncharacterized protein [Panulirus ornatus]|uniref:uncharacterized protein n=1 Tax=Panulirus ornatus TaxID=150431 RepID=UPI003A89EC13
MRGFHTREADFAPGLFFMTLPRAQVVDFSWPSWTDELRILAALGRPEVDTWGFLLPFAPSVWAAIVTSLLVLPAVFLSLLRFLRVVMPGKWKWSTEALSFVRVLFQQGIPKLQDWWSWERLVLGVWMMMTLVLTRSYSGNLMSLLAVRHIPQPYHTLRDVLDDSTVAMIWQKNSAQEQYLHSVESGIFREVADLEDEGRLKFLIQTEFRDNIDTVVRRGDHVFTGPSTALRHLVTQDFSQTGRCDFYISREGFLPFSASMISQKHSPLSHAISKRVMTMTEFGIFQYWFIGGIPNGTYCLYLPRQITVSTSFSTKHIWGMLIVFACAQTAGILLYSLEGLSTWGSTLR